MHKYEEGAGQDGKGSGGGGQHYQPHFDVLPLSASYASWIFRKASCSEEGSPSAAAEVGVAVVVSPEGLVAALFALSGWYSRTFLRYCFFISSKLAPSSTPKIW